MKPTLAPLLALALVAPSALGDHVVLTERLEDLRGRNRVEKKLATTTVDFKADEWTIGEVVEWLRIVSGEGVNYVVLVPDVDEVPLITLNLTKVRVASVLGVVSDVTSLAFVYRAGVVMVKPQADVKEETFLRLYDVRAAVQPLTNFPAPEIGNLRPSGYEPDEPEVEESTGTLSGFDTDQLAEMVRNNVLPDTWDTEGRSVQATNGVLIVRQTAGGHLAVQRVLAQLGVFSGPFGVGRAGR